MSSSSFVYLIFIHHKFLIVNVNTSFPYIFPSEKDVEAIAIGNTPLGIYFYKSNCCYFTNNFNKCKVGAGTILKY